MVGKYAGRPLLSLKRTVAGRKQGRRFKAASANETQRVRTDCFVRMQGVSDKDYGRHTSVLIFRRPLCHLYIYNLHSGSLKPHLNVILATTASYLGAKTSQWSRQNVQKCSDARICCKKLASGRISVADGGILCCDAGKRSEKLASRGVDKGNDMN